MNKRGFAFIELLVTMVTISILLVIAVPRFANRTKESHITTMKSNTAVLSELSTLYYKKNNEWPTKEAVTDANILSADGFPALGTIYSLDIDKYNGFVDIKKDELEKYGLVKNGFYKGKVFHLNGIEDKNGVNHYSAELTDDTTFYEIAYNTGTEEITSRMVLEGDYATPPTPPLRRDKKFVGWDKHIDEVTQSEVITAVWDTDLSDESKPDKPTTPDKPIVPDKPDKPQPDKPEIPEEPELPEIPILPGEPQYGLITNNNFPTQGISKILDDGSIRLYVLGRNSGIQIKNGENMQLEGNKTYRLSYSYDVIRGRLVSFGGHVKPNLATRTKVYLNGVPNSDYYPDNDSAYPDDFNSNEKYAVDVIFQTPDEITSGDDSSDDSIWIQPNRGRLRSVTVRISDIYLSEVKSMS